MPGDYSRRTFDPKRDVVGVFEQQGRVRLDANINELVDALDRRLRATSLDTLGPAVVPKETPDGFLIGIAGGGLTIGPGRAYVDGIQVDNHGRARAGLVDAHFEARLEEVRGTGVIPFDDQPYVPVAPSPWAPPVPPAGQYLAYLLLRHRERTWAEDPSLLDPALYGIDTATRRQLIWQVRLHRLQGPGVDCETPDDEIPGWDDVIRPAAARLTTGAVGVPANTDPCIIPPNGGFRGVENRLYRVEVHRSGGFGQATFKWSRDNGSLASPVTSINGAELGVVRPGRDEILRFATGDWVEVTDDDRELMREPGEMARVQSVDDVRGVVVLNAPLVGAFNAADPGGANTRIRRWDQRNVGLSGVLPLTNAPVVLEDGVQVTFTLDPDIAGGQFSTLEHWVFSARVADGSVEVLADAPPAGPHDHIARLAVVDTVAGTVIDCRVPWPPPAGEGGCECDGCVTEESHNSGAFTIQDAVNDVVTAGGTVCLGPGVYRLRAPVTVQGANAVRIRGKGWTTIVLTPGNRPAFLIEESRQVTVQDLTVLGTGGRDLAEQESLPLALLGGRTAISVSNSLATTIERCVLVTRPLRRDRMPTLATLGIVAGLTVRENVIVGAVALGNPLPKSDVGVRPGRRRARQRPGSSVVFGPADDFAQLDDRQKYVAGRLLLAHWNIVDNLMVGGRAGVALLGPLVAAFDNRISRNDVLVGGDVGIALAGLSIAAAPELSDNMVGSPGFGIVAGIDGARIDDNEVMGVGGPRLAAVGAVFAGSLGDLTAAGGRAPSASTALWPSHVCGHDFSMSTVAGLKPSSEYDKPQGVLVRAGILVVDGLGLRARMGRVRVTGNEVAGIEGYGIAVTSPVRDLLVATNRVHDVAIGGIVVPAPRAGSVVVAGNLVEGIGFEGGGTVDAFLPVIGVAGIVVTGAEETDIRDNRVNGVNPFRGRATGIAVDAVRRVRVADNRVNRIGNDTNFAFGVLIDGPFHQVDVNDNELPGDGSGADSRWTAVIIRGASEVVKVGAAAAATKRAMASYAYRYVDAAGTDFLILVGKRVAALDVGPELTAVRGNTLAGEGFGPLVQLLIDGHAMFNDNRCRLVGRPRMAAVGLMARSAILNANYVEASEKGVAIEADVDRALVTTLGNITRGDIIVGGANLAGTQWEDLNVVAV